MKFQSVNELEQFDFQDAVAHSYTNQAGNIYVELEAVRVKVGNSQNTNYTESYAGELTMRLVNADIQKGIKEGYKYYNANDVLVEEVPDTSLSQLEIGEILKNIKGCYIWSMVPVEASQNDTGRFLYLMGIDKDEETTYWLQIAFDQSILEWDKYMNRVER